MAISIVASKIWKNTTSIYNKKTQQNELELILK